MKLSKLVSSTERLIRGNSSTILTALSISGVVSTAYLTAKASFKAANALRDEHENKQVYPGWAPMTLKESAKFVWKLYIPAGVSGFATIACVVSAQRVGSRRTAAAQAAFSLSERAFSEYRDKVVETVGANKEQAIRDEIAQDRVNRNQPPSSEIMITGPGNILCCEALTGRYFTSDHESLRKAQNDLNAKLVAHGYAYLDDFYYMIGIAGTSHSSKLGWESDKMMELQFSTTLTPDNRPCLVFDYNYTKPL